MTTLPKLLKEIMWKKECKREHHQWELSVAESHSDIYHCKYCPAILIEPVDCGTGA